MAINPVRSGSIGTIAVDTDGGKTAGNAPERTAQRSSNAEAIRVELSPAARLASAASAITGANQNAAASADWFSSAQGRAALSALAPSHGRAVTRL